jgi:hypothetical protein
MLFEMDVTSGLAWFDKFVPMQYLTLPLDHVLQMVNGSATDHDESVSIESEKRTTDPADPVNSGSSGLLNDGNSLHAGANARVASRGMYRRVLFIVVHP